MKNRFTVLLPILFVGLQASASDMIQDGWIGFDMKKENGSQLLRQCSEGLSDSAELQSSKIALDQRLLSAISIEKMRRDIYTGVASLSNWHTTAVVTTVSVPLGIKLMIAGGGALAAGSGAGLAVKEFLIPIGISTELAPGISFLSSKSFESSATDEKMDLRVDELVRQNVDAINKDKFCDLKKLKEGVETEENSIYDEINGKNYMIKNTLKLGFPLQTAMYKLWWLSTVRIAIAKVAIQRSSLNLQ